MNKLEKAMLIYVISDNNILLGRKQKKVAKGKWSGYGGKQEPGDTSMHHTAIRELFEETGEGIVANEKDLIPQAVIDFTLNNSEGNNFSMKVFMYLLENFEGEFSDTDEMKDHRWFPLGQIPYENMLVDNQVFLPKILNREYFIAEIISENGEVVKADFTEKTKEEIELIFKNN